MVIMRNAVWWDVKLLMLQRNLLAFVLYPVGGGSTRLQGVTFQKTEDSILQVYCLVFKCIHQ